MDISRNFQQLMSLGEMAYVKDGELYRGREGTAVMVESSGDLEVLAGILNPGSIAFTAGFGNAWQLNTAGEWVQWMTEESD